MILHNGPIYTMDPRLPQVRALAVAGDVLAGGVDVREGDLDTVGHERVDLEGRCVLPGFSDSHLHFRSWALERTAIDLTGCGSMAEALRAVGESDAADGWLFGRGWREARWPDGPPTAAALDAVTGGRPAALWAHDGHTLWLNGAALAAAGTEHATGVLHEREAWEFPLPEPPAAVVTRAVLDAMRDANAHGVVAIHDLEAAGGRGLWQKLDADRRLTLRVHMGVPAEQLGSARMLELRSGFGSELVRVGPVKAFMDGTLGSGTAWMLDGGGDVLTTREELQELVVEAAAGGLHVAVHAIGDAANRAALDAFEHTRHVWEDALMRPRIEHAQCVTDADLPRFAGIGVIASVQPSHATSDRDVADALWGERARLAYRTRDLLESGAALVFGSDAPVEPLEPLAGIHAAVHRTSDDREPWHPGQRISVADAVHGFTAAGAYAVGEERRRGLLLPGFAADLVVLDTDIVAHPERIADASVEATMLAGRWVHNPPPW
ncbi:MAG: amidohydrolase [Gaiellales bacterium]